MKSWYQIRAQADNPEVAEILIYDDIGYFGITAKNFVEDLRALGDIKKITVRINSYGGEGFDGFAIFNVLARHPAEVTVWIDGIAASIASVVAMAGDKIIMPDNAFLMIHRSWGLVIGNSEDMLSWADIMEKFDKSIVLAYQKKSPKSAEEIMQLMSDESWLTATEAKAWGFADEISDPIKLAARATFRIFNKLPEALKNAPQQSETEAAPDPTPDPAPAPEPAPETAPQPTVDPAAIRVQAAEEANRTAREVYNLCAKAGVPDAAGDFLNRGMTADQVRERLAEAPTIRDVCAAAHVPDRAGDYIKKGLSLKEVRNLLFDVMKIRDIEINNKLGPEDRRINTVPAFSASEIYAARRKDESGRKR